MTSFITRRQFVAGAGVSGAALLAACGRLPWQSSSQQPARVPRIGYLTGSTATGNPSYPSAFREGLRDLGYVEGQNVVIEYRYADGDFSRLPELAMELVRLPVDVIVTGGGPLPVQAAHSATDTVPIVMLYAGDPVASGLVAALARPGGNVTGLTYFVGQLTDKRLELLKDTLPGLTRAAYLRDANLYDPDTTTRRQDLAGTAASIGVQLQSIDVRAPGDLDAAFEAATRERAEALLLGGGFFINYRPHILGLAAQHNLPAMYWAPEFVREGGLMGYSASLSAQWRRAAYFVDRILQGTKPADLPVEQPMTFEFVVNLKTARELGITFPHEILLQVTEVIDQ
jgi:putative ABC transport system substrate-binding protein